ncbi:MAG: acyl-CoA dehydrogenase family protein [Streptosporangiaceae bacterium]
MTVSDVWPPLEDDLADLADAVRTFSADRLTEPAARAEESDTLREELVQALGGQGLWTLGVPERHGGGGADLLALSVAMQGIATVAPVAAAAVATAHAAYLAVAEASAVAAGGLPVLIDTTDPLTSVRVTRCAAGWSVDGTASRVEGAGAAALFVVVDPEAGALLVEPSACTIGRPMRRCGLRGLPPHPVTFHDARFDVGASAPAEATRARATLLTLLGATACGIAESAWAAARDYAGSRAQFGRRLREFPALACRLDEMAEQTRGRLLILTDAAREAARQAGHASRTDPARVAARCARTAVEVADAAIQLHGGYGYLAEYPVERGLRDAVTVRALVAQAASRSASANRHGTGTTASGRDEPDGNLMSAATFSKGC